MWAYITRRLLLAIVTVSLVALLVFAMINALPGSVIEARLADSPQAREELIPKLKRELGLDKPRPVQFIQWYLSALQGDLGKSLWSDEPVAHAIRRAFPVTVEIALLAISVSVAVAVPFGVLAAVFQDRFLDHVTRIISVGALAVPDFWVGTVVVIFSSRFIGYTVPLSYKPLLSDPSVNLQLVGVAAAIIGLRLTGSLVRLTRSAMLEVLRQDYMRTARAKGLSEYRIIMYHGLRNASLPVITLIGLQFSTLLGGTVIMETIFGIPGIGRLLIAAIQTRDFVLVQGVTLMFGVALVLINLAIDVAYGYLDPRIRLHGW